MSSLDSTKVLSYESVHWKVTSLWVNSLKGLTTSLSFGQNLARKLSMHKKRWVFRFGHVYDCFDHGWSWANHFWSELETHENHLPRFKPPLGRVQFEFHLLHSHQKIVKIVIMVFLGLLFCLSTSINKDIISNVADAFQSCKSFLLSCLILLGAT